MSRREQREQIFKILFGVEFHSAEELDEQIALYMEELGEIRQKEADYILNKVHSIVEHLDDLDSSLNAASKNWKTTRMAKAELSILRLAAYEIKYEEDIPVSEAWKKTDEFLTSDETFYIGATANTFEDIKRAVEQGASYIGLGPFRHTETKKKLSPVLGLEGYQKIIQQCKDAGYNIPIFAIGGICLEDVGALMQTGITGIAVSGAIINADDPVEETRRFINEINKY